jgi:beta-glucosidase
MASLKVEKSWIKATDTVQATNEKHEGGDGLYDTIVSEFSALGLDANTGQYVARVNVTNTGSAAGAEVAQLYMSYPQSEVEQPPRHLKGFNKVYLQPGQTQTVQMHLVSGTPLGWTDSVQRKKDISVWDVKHQIWRIPNGRFVFYAGNSSRNLPLEFKLDVKDKK